MAKTDARVERVTEKIYPQTTTRNGFTLLEVIIVISIIAFVATMVLPKLMGRNTEIRGIIRQLAVLNKDLKNRAKLQSSTYRLALLMGQKNQKPFHQFWVEKAPGLVINNYDPKNPPKLVTDEEETPEEGAPPPVFQVDTQTMKKPRTLPDGMVFESVELSSLEAPVTSGLVYIHYLPSGYADEAAIQINYDKKLFWTLSIQPLTGQVDIFDEKVTLQEILAQ